MKEKEKNLWGIFTNIMCYYKIENRTYKYEKTTSNFQETPYPTLDNSRGDTKCLEIKVPVNPIKHHLQVEKT